MSVKTLRLGVFGFGCVGRGLYETLQASGFDRAVIKRICIKDPEKERNAPAELFTTDPQTILADPEIDAVVELIDDANAAYTLVTSALRQGKAVVTANKKLVAEHLEELIQLQQETGVPLLYEAACCASIPVIRNLEEYYDNDLVQRVEGVLNGSTNYILTQLASGNSSYPEALAAAQRLGFAESDPRLDVEGYDTRYKLTLLLAHAFGLLVKPEDIPFAGITRLNAQALNRAARNGEVIRLLGRCWKEGEQVFACVLPTLVERGEELAQVNFEYNGVVVEGAFSDRQFFRGKGAGSWPTGAAVLSDISALTYNYRYAYKKMAAGKQLTFTGDFPVWVRLSGTPETGLPFHAFDEVTGSFRGLDEAYLEGRISIRNLLKITAGADWCAVGLTAAQVTNDENTKRKKAIA